MCPDWPTMQDSAFDLLNKLCRGNPGAAVVLYQIFLTVPDAYNLLQEIDAVGWGGARIWEIYKDACREDSDAFVRLVKRMNSMNELCRLDGGQNLPSMISGKPMTSHWER